MKNTRITRIFSLLCVLSVCVSLLCVPASAVEGISIEAQAALLIDVDTGQTLYSRNADVQRAPASITKIMTALLTLEAVGRGELSMDTVITAPDNTLEALTEDSSTAGIVPGEQMTLENVLYCLMLSSANEAANILAITVAGDIPSFVARMNQRAQELGMENTHFANPHGLDNSEHYSTAYDIYLMAKEAMTHAAFREIVGSPSHTVPATNTSDSRLLYNTNGLLTGYKYPGYSYKGTIGIKTGSTTNAGYCLCAAVQKEGHTMISVVLGCENPPNPEDPDDVIRKQFVESKRLQDWGFTNYSYVTLMDVESQRVEVPVKFSFNSAHVLLQPAHEVKVLVPGEYDESKVELELNLYSETAAAPIAQGQSLGTMTVMYDGAVYDTVDMVAVSDVALSAPAAFITTVNEIAGSLLFRVILAAVLLLFLYLIVRRFRHDRKRRLVAARREARERNRQREAERRRRGYPSGQQRRPPDRRNGGPNNRGGRPGGRGPGRYR